MSLINYHIRDQIHKIANLSTVIIKTTTKWMTTTLRRKSYQSDFDPSQETPTRAQNLPGQPGAPTHLAARLTRVLDLVDTLAAY